MNNEAKHGFVLYLLDCALQAVLMFQ